MRLSMAALLVTTLCITAPDLSAKDYMMTPSDVPVLGELDAYFVNTVYNNDANKDGKLADFIDTQKYRDLIKKHNIKLLGGPMLGGVTSSSARIWVRTPFESSVSVTVAKDDQSAPIATFGPTATTKNSDLVAVVELSGLSPDTRYFYNILIDDTPVFSADRPSFSTFPGKGRPKSFSVAFGGGMRYVPEREHIWDTVLTAKPDAFLLLGDNVYHDKPGSGSGQRVHYYRRQMRPEFKRLVSRVPSFAVWDDHDFGWDNCEGGPETDSPGWKVRAWNVFIENWANPSYGAGPEKRGVWFDFSIGAVDFFMLDSRYYKDKGKTMLGPLQKQWLKDRLKESNALFKVIASPVPWAFGAKPGSNDPWNGFKSERNELFDFLHNNKIEGVILISADRHRHDAWKLSRSNGYDLYEFMSSRMTNDHRHGCMQDRECLFCIKDRGFGLLDFDFDKPVPEVTYRIRNDEGKEQYALTVSYNDIAYKPVKVNKGKEPPTSGLPPDVLARELAQAEQVRIFDARGGEVSVGNGKGRLTLKTLQELPSGVYFVDMKIGDKQLMRQWMSRTAH